MNVHFEKAQPSHIEIIFEWLAEVHMMEFWDNSQEHKDDLVLENEFFDLFVTYALLQQFV